MTLGAQRWRSASGSPGWEQLPSRQGQGWDLAPTCFKDVGKGQRVGSETHGVAGATLRSSNQQVKEFRVYSPGRRHRTRGTFGNRYFWRQCFRVGTFSTFPLATAAWGQPVVSLSVGELSGGSVSMLRRWDSQRVGGVQRGPCRAGLHATWLPLLLLGDRPAALRAGSKPAVLSRVLSWAPLSVCFLGDAAVYHCSWEGDPLPPTPWVQMLHLAFYSQPLAPGGFLW